MPSRTKIAEQLRADDIRCLQALADGQLVQPRTNEIVEQYELTIGEFLAFWLLDACAALFFIFRFQDTDPVIAFGGATFFLGLFLAYEIDLRHDRKKALQIYPSIDGLLAAKTQLNLDAPFIITPILFSLLCLCFILALLAS